MKKLLIASLVATLALTACKKEEAPAEPKADTQTTEQAPTQPAQEHSHDDHQHDHTHEHKDGDKDHHHAHGNHSHDHAHAHHHAGDTYKCDNNKTVAIAIHDHEGEIEAHATIDDVEYDLHPEDGKKDTYISKEEGINDKGMRMTLADGKATFNDLDGKVLLSCQK